MASNVIDDGMGLELTDLGSPESGTAIEAFWHDDGSGFDFHRPSRGHPAVRGARALRGRREEEPAPSQRALRSLHARPLIGKERAHIVA
jgi:hypothetical protein